MRFTATLLLALALGPAAAAADKLTLMLDWFANPDHAPIYVALESGYFADAGLDVVIQEPADPNDPPKLVAAGRADIAITYQPNLYMQVDQGLPLVRFGTLISTPLNMLLALDDGPVKSIADLKGKRIGYSVGGFEEAVLKTMLESSGLTLADVSLVNVNFSLAPSLMAGNVDAVIGAYRNFELNILDLEGRKGRAFMVEDHGVPLYDELIFVARRDEMQSDTRYARFLDAIERGVAKLANDPEGAWALFVNDRPKLDDELNRRAFRDTLPRFAASPAALDARRYARFARFMKEQGVIGEAKPVSAYAVALE